MFPRARREKVAKALLHPINNRKNSPLILKMLPQHERVRANLTESSALMLTEYAERRLK
jgi:hypothetical protein